MNSETGVILRDTYSQTDAPDPVLDPATVLALARRHAPGARAVEAVDETGGEARAYMVVADEGQLVLKTQRPHRLRARTSLSKEAAFLRHLAALPGDPLPVPRVLGYGRAATRPETEYTLMSRITGDAMARSPIEGPARHRALAELGAVLRRVHQAPQAPLLDSGLFPGDRAPGDLRVRLETPALDAARRLADTPGAVLPPEAVEALVARSVAALPDRYPRVALHSNPSATHTFIDPTTGIFTGLIDFGDAYVSHPALDLRRWDTHEDRLAVLEGYQRAGAVGADFLLVWRTACALAELTALAARRATGPTAATRAAVIRSLLEELDPA